MNSQALQGRPKIFFTNAEPNAPLSPGLWPGKPPDSPPGPVQPPEWDDFVLEMPKIWMYSV
jgi:hypothetical protein